MLRARWTIAAALTFIAGALSSWTTPPAASGQEKTAVKTAIEGTWLIDSVEVAGAKVDSLKGAELVLASGGKKTFTLPGGVVEKGTYSIDESASPAQIDATTDGKEGTEPGIFELKGDALKMCLGGPRGARPTRFTTGKDGGVILIEFKRGMAKAPPSHTDNNVAPQKPTGSRTFRMGFTGFVHDITPEAVAASRKFVRENGDILAHHIEGAAWAESLSGKPFPKPLLDEWEGKKSATPKNGKVYLAISPGRGELKVQDKAGPLPKELSGKEYDDPLVMKTYLTYCKRAIEFFKPDYLCIGIEVNEIHRDGGVKKWNAYAKLHEYIYKELKKEHKDLPIFASCTLHSTFAQRGGMLESFKKLMPYNDLVAVSYYPFFVPEKDRLSALDWLLEQFDEFKKPYTMVETNDSAERLPLPQLKITLEGTPEKQSAYYQKLLDLAQKRKFAFVISFIHQDYDLLWEKIKAASPELFKAWRDCGFLDESGKERPALEIWKAYLALPLADPAKP